MELTLWYSTWFFWYRTPAFILPSWFYILGCLLPFPTFSTRYQMRFSLSWKALVYDLTKPLRIHRVVSKLPCSRPALKIVNQIQYSTLISWKSQLRSSLEPTMTHKVLSRFSRKETFPFSSWFSSLEWHQGTFPWITARHRFMFGLKLSWGSNVI